MTLRQALIVFVCGLIFSAAFPPTNAWFLMLTLVPLFIYVAQSERPRDAFFLGFWFTVGLFSLHIFWLPVSFQELFGPVAWLMYIPLVPTEAAIWGLIMLLARLLGGRGYGSLWLLPAFWILMDWARSQGALAFPWGNLGYIWLESAIGQLADIAGVYGLGFLTTVMAALLAVPFVGLKDKDSSSPLASQTPSPLRFIFPILALAVGTGAWLLGLNREQMWTKQIPEPNQQALLVQGNTDPLGRFTGDSPDLVIYTELTAEGIASQKNPPDLVVWPEGAILDAALNQSSAQNIRTIIQESAPSATIVTGGVAYDLGQTPRDIQSFNSIFSLVDGQVVDRYDKLFLVPFGEARLFHRQLKPVYDVIYGWFGMRGFRDRTAGSAVDPLATPLGKAASYICYESVFPQIARTMTAKGANVLILSTNDSWFSRGNGAEQHYDMGRMRAIETRRYLLRAGNDGVTAVVDPFGRELERLERKTRGWLVGDYAMMDVVTPYVRYGDVLIWSLMAYVVLMSAIIALRRS